MGCKTFFAIKVTLVALLFSSCASSSTLLYSSSCNNVNSNVIIDRAYIYAQHRLGVPQFRKFSIEEMLYPTSNVMGLSKSFTGNLSVSNMFNGNGTNPFTSDYVPTYNISKVSFGGGIGYLVKEYLRLELEAFYESFDLNDDDYLHKDYKYFALIRHDNKKVIIENQGLKSGSILLNVCYDALNSTLKQYNIFPYFCAGAGAGLVNFLDSNSVKLAYQGKSGISFIINSHVVISLGAYYHGVIGNRFSNLPTMHKEDLNAGKVFAESTLSISYFGTEFGVRFNL
ncbi:P44/Msp2 family outer membrane protein [Neoehrlichia mikurensis]|uniref:P44/Msp2 family outer membrane protein n=1 Tax=Neoehrlichia mikurensis TaxID=89586 RepID=A0A9Q9BYM6_9RICK|nr:P44/Msp2 family outer membrane protein [Neoehrlichia mikurensis]QXK91597.1 P44/Msp2 family outer membrane protein [Neoehrlichia mikurensis]QXK92808.1 P44/Msp2 family outer membrane protein [Neoehrlichia mikurensis]QXK93287.1 P44/Msp2 family outer membrane protein [Neoehrlichia mikurensis]UTO55771.1 P44/Msp2 family outer membrane protein [Neoehrlichia mikurensis]